MMKRISFVITALIAMLMNVSAMDNNDFLKASGKVLKKNSGTGDVVYLRGTNAGNIGIQEPWMCTTAATDNVKCERDIYALLTRRFGADGAQMLLNTYRDNYFTAADFDRIADMGMNCIRVPLWYRDFENADGTMRSDAFTWLDWFIYEAGKRGIYVIIDMHGAHGSQNGRDHSGACANNDSSWDEIWASEFFFGGNASVNQEKYYQLWEKIADHYKGNPAVAGYDILNEPFCTYRYNNYEVYGTKWDETQLHNLLWGIYDNTYKRIRAKDPNHLIIMEATWDPWDLPNPSTYNWINVMYEYHQYNYGDYDNANGEQITGIQNKVNSIKNQGYDVPSYIGEFCFFDKTLTWAQGLRVMNNAGLNWTTWSYKCISDFGNWGLMNENSNKINLETASYDEILAKWKALHSASWINAGLANTLKSNLKNEFSVPGEVCVATCSSMSDGMTINNKGYIGDTGNGKNITFTLKFNETGTYKLTLPLAAGEAQWNAKSLTVKLDNTEVATMTVTGSSGWETFIDHTCQFNVSTAGTHTLTLVVNGGACNISSFTLSKQ